MNFKMNLLNKNKIFKHNNKIYNKRIKISNKNKKMKNKKRLIPKNNKRNSVRLEFY